MPRTELEQYYYDNDKEVSDGWVDYCFHEGRFETGDDKAHYDNDTAFWEYVQTKLDKLKTGEV